MSAADLILRWCDIYTRGLSPTVAGDRRAELASDLHEHAAWRPADGAAMMSRAIRGVPADLAWRHGQRRAAARLLPMSTRVVSGTIGALVAVAASSLLVFGTFAVARTASVALRGEIRPWSETALWVIGLTLLTVAGSTLVLRHRTRVFGAVVLAASAPVIHFGLYDLYSKSATIGALSFAPGWSESIACLIGAYVVLFLSAAIVWLPARTKVTA